ncbi:Hypothetical protein ING2D1G_0056 [Peptoniphilus sp. ING2-D1G]|nr:Hypothetical protein ING2D1G_0056 [Peptoniphilus sp. ING2-D1G]
MNYESDYAKLANGNELDSPFGEQNQDGVITITRGSHDVLRIQANPAQPEALPTLIANIADDTKLTHISIFTDSKDGYQLPAGWRVYAIDQSGAEIIDPTADYYGVDIRVDVPPYANTGDIAAFAAEITYSDGTKDIQTFRYTVNPRPSYIEYSYKDIMRYAGDKYTVNPEVNPLTQVAGYVEPIKREFSDEAGNLLTAATITDSKGTEWTIGTDIIIDGETGVISGKVPDGALSGAVLEVNVRTTYDNQDAATQGTNPHVYDYKTLRITVITPVTQPDYALLYGKPGETKNADISILYGEEYKTVFAKFDRQANEAKGWTIVDQLVDKEGTNLDTPSADLSNYKRVATTVQRSDGRIYPVVEIFDQNDVSLGYLSQKATNADGWEYKLNPSTGYIMSTIPETAKVGENASIQIHIEYNNDPNRFTKILADTYAIEKDAEKYEPNYPALVVTRGATDATLSTPIDLTTQQAFDNKDVQNFTIDNTAVPGWEISIDNATGQVSVKVDQSIPVGTKLTKDVTITYNDGSKDIVPVTFVANEQILNPNYAPKDGAVGDEIISEIIAIDPNNPTKQDYPPQGTKFILVSDSENWGVTIDEATGKLTGTVPLDKKPGEKTDLIVRVDYPDGTSELVATSFTVKAFTSETIDISAVKNWVGGDTANRPDIQLQLFRQATDDQGTPIGNKEFVGEAKTLTNGNTTAEWTSLPKQNETKQNYLYTVEEVQGAEGYTTAVTGDQTSGFTVTNTFVPEETYEFYYEMKTTAPGSDVVSDLVGTYPDGTTFEIVNSMLNGTIQLIKTPVKSQVKHLKTEIPGILP